MHMMMCIAHACAVQLQLMRQHQSASKYMRGIQVKQEPQAHAYYYLYICMCLLPYMLRGKRKPAAVSMNACKSVSVLFVSIGLLASSCVARGSQQQ
jgi:hypothetical protein